MTDPCLCNRPSSSAPIHAPNLDDGTGDPDDLGHIVDQHLPGNGLMEAMANGSKVTALCGHRFVPTRGADGLPVCKGCRDALAMTT